MLRSDCFKVFGFLVKRGVRIFFFLINLKIFFLKRIFWRFCGFFLVGDNFGWVFIRERFVFEGLMLGTCIYIYFDIDFRSLFWLVYLLVFGSRYWY